MVDLVPLPGHRRPSQRRPRKSHGRGCSDGSAEAPVRLRRPDRYVTPSCRSSSSGAKRASSARPCARHRRRAGGAASLSMASRRTTSHYVLHHESRMNKPRIFLGSSGKQAKLLQAITRGLEDVADVKPWTTTFNPGRSTLDRLVKVFPGGRFRRVRFRPGRLDHDGCVPVRPGVAARQRCVDFSSAARSASGARSSSMRMVRSCQATCSG